MRLSIFTEPGKRTLAHPCTLCFLSTPSLTRTILTLELKMAIAIVPSMTPFYLSYSQICMQHFIHAAKSSPSYSLVVVEEGPRPPGVDVDLVDLRVPELPPARGHDLDAAVRVRRHHLAGVPEAILQHRRQRVPCLVI